MFSEFLRVSNADNTEIFFIADDDGNVYIIDDNEHKTIGYCSSWSFDTSSYAEYINECDEIMYMDDSIIDELKIDNGENLKELNSKGIANVISYLND